MSDRLWEGEDIRHFERAFAEFIGVPEAVAVPSGRAGLKFIFDGLDLQRGDEVICSAFGYPIVPHLVRSLGYKLRFVDCEMQTLGMDPDALAAAITDNTRMVIATHLYGVPCRIHEIAKICDTHGAALIEDCAHCFGASVRGEKTGSIGLAGYFSFETSKPVNTLGGGMITTRDPDVAAKMRAAGDREPRKKLKWLFKRLLKTGFEATATHPFTFNLGVYPLLRYAPRGKGGEDRFASGYDGDQVSMEGKMGRYTALQARLGQQQMERAKADAERRVANAERLISKLRDCVQFQEPAGDDAHANYMLVTALFPKMEQMSRALLKLGVDTKHHYMRDCSGLLDTAESFPNAARAEREGLHIPTFPQLRDDQIDWIATKVRQAVEQVGVARRPEVHSMDRSAVAQSEAPKETRPSTSVSGRG
jgi:dTDP-4-amino-4,6-dideoxygalactose transaminase